MPNFRRWFHPGGTYFFTVNTYQRRPIFHDEMARGLLRDAIEEVRKELPFDILGFVLLPEHLHTIWKLPDNDIDFPKRWNIIKRRFSQKWVTVTDKKLSRTKAMARKRDSGVWQSRFWEHWIRDDGDFGNHMNYIHYNPIKHGLVECPHQWSFSTFHRWVKEGAYPEDWLCSCKRQIGTKPTFLENVSGGE